MSAPAAGASSPRPGAPAAAECADAARERARGRSRRGLLVGLRRGAATHTAEFGGSGGRQPPRTSRKAVVASFQRAHCDPATIFPPVLISDHPPHLVGESAAGSAATAGGGTGGMHVVPCWPRHARARRAGARAFPHACARTPSRPPPHGHAPPPTPTAGRERADAARRGRGRDSNLDPACGFLLCPSGRPATPTPRTRHGATCVGWPAWGRGQAAPGGRETRQRRLGTRARPAAPTSNATTRPRLRWLAAGFVAPLITQTPTLSPRR